MRHTLRCTLLLFTGALVFCFLNARTSRGQTISRVQPTADETSPVRMNSLTHPPAKRSSEDERKDEASRLTALEDALRDQRAQLEELRKLMIEQQETIKLLTGKLAGLASVDPREGLAGNAAAGADTGSTRITAAAPQTPSVEDRLKKVEGRISEIGAIKFSGDIRLRSESFFGLSNNLATGNNPAALGNELNPRHRMRFRARLALRGSVGDEFDWGLRLATGSFADNISTNQTLLIFSTANPSHLIRLSSPTSRSARRDCDCRGVSLKRRGVPQK